MADEIPAKLRQPEISRFVRMAHQMRPYMPAMAYWCEYAAVVNIMKLQLHNADDECRHFTTSLMDRLEQIKNERPSDEAIANEAQGRTYVERFAEETLARAARVMAADKVTKTTAVTFEAAATYYQVAGVWGEPDAQTAKKIKFCKYHARRIFMAIKEGKDPNESNPKDAVDDGSRLADLDPDDPEVKALLSTADGGDQRQATVEDADDTWGSGRRMPPTAMSPTVVPAPALVSPTISEPGMPDGPPSLPDHPLGKEYQETFNPSPMSQSPGQRWATPSQPSLSHLTPLGPPVPPPSIPPGPILSAPTRIPPLSPKLPLSTTSPMDLGPSAPAPTWNAAATGGAGNYSQDENDMAAAQKHAKWAISALNFDDVPTAVKELRNALAALGAR